MSQKDSLGDRMKRYEDVSRYYLTQRLPLIIRLDGKAFHTWTRGLPRPYCSSLMAAMDEVTKHLCSQVQNTVMGYTQSDEISLLVVDFKFQWTTPWFDSNLQKMVSVAASMAASKMTALSPTIFGGLRDSVKEAVFDARAFVLPPHEVNNYFIWRQQDWNRNSLAMLAQSLFSHRELQGKVRAEQHEMCFTKGHNWTALSSHIKDGRVVVREQVEKPYVVDEPDGTRHMGSVFRSEWRVLEKTPIFSDDREFVARLLAPGDQDAR